MNRKDETGRRKHKNFQCLTDNKRSPKLRDHLGVVVGTMRLSVDWHDFKTKLDTFYPRQRKPPQLSFDYKGEQGATEPEGGLSVRPVPAC